MNKEEFHKYLVSPDKLDKGSILEVHDLINEFPYFQTAHMMLLKNLYILGNIKFDSQLRKSAAYIGNRTILYYLLQKKEVIEEVKDSEQKQEQKIEKPVEKKSQEKVPEKEESKEKDKKEKIITEKSEAKEPVEKPKKDALADIVLKRIEEIKKTQKGSGSGEPTSSSKVSTGKSNTSPGEKKKPEKKEEDQVADPVTDQILQLASDDVFRQDISEDKGEINANKRREASDDNGLFELDEENEEEIKSDELIDRFIRKSPTIEPRKMSNFDKEKKDISEFSAEEIIEAIQRAGYKAKLK